MSGFHEVRFPDNIAYGATGGPEFATTVVATGSGHEKRNVNWAQARGRWDVASGLKKQAQIDELIAFFRARSVYVQHTISENIPSGTRFLQLDMVLRGNAGGSTLPFGDDFEASIDYPA
jgi:hypothetical protein